MRQSLVWLLLLWQASSGLCTNAKYYQETYKDEPIQRGGQNKHVASPKTDVLADQSHSNGPQPGSDLVDAAMIELAKNPQSSHQRKRRPSGLVGTLMRYIVKAIPKGPSNAPSQSHDSNIRGSLLEAIKLLEEAARQNNSDALYLLADMNFYSNYSHPRNLEVAFNHYQQLAAVHGNTTAQYMMGLYYSTGLGDVVPRDQAKALLYYTFAAIRGDIRAEMATAYRHHAGIGTTKNCEAAVKYYKSVADKAIAWYRAGPPGGRTWVHQAWRISDDDGGIYGEGASASSAGMNAYKSNPASDANAAIDDVIEYLDLMSQKGDSKASYNLGRIYYEGQRGLPRNIPYARKYFFLVASRYWKNDGRVLESYKQGVETIASKAAGYLGRMYLRGDGVKVNFERAKFWFERGISQGDAQSQHGLGLMMLNGYGSKENVKLAMELFRKSADQDFAPALVQMGQLYLDQGGQDDVRVANNYFELAGRHSNIEAHYYIAEMIHHGVGREKLCGASLTYYKSVAEKSEPLVSSWGDANDAYEAGDYELAFLEYLMAAEQGYEKAQTNVAYTLDSIRSRLLLSSVLPEATEKKKSILDNPALALIYWTRSSRQSNVDALVKMGDYYYYGVGTDLDISKAVQCYTGASDYSQSAQALFNLGWMHENGIGLVQDFHLAKRYYDHALEVNEEAYLPATLSLLKLRIRSAWNTLTHGPIHSIQDEPKPKKTRSLSEWIANFLMDDTIQYEEDTYVDNLYDDPLGNGDGLNEDDGVMDSFLIIGVTFGLFLLLWWRQRLQQRHAEQQEAIRRQQQGLPPDPPRDNGRDAAEGFAEWAAGGAGLL
ncbi:hypothetical protein B0T10DRAFT_20691 [Thelonectria olida]|uniref:Uncharacterized protein n=1 Tax=Thelonectria olida TaxID=1576542 RepID=A0A9P8WM14_9HYPO|nr:hypothetical protein B0T10DRAFT_20691 [Thelonectria olida]